MVIKEKSGEESGTLKKLGSNIGIKMRNGRKMGSKFTVVLARD